MSIFGGSERFPNEAARSPGPIYAKPDVRANGRVVMKPDYTPLDETRKWGKRESWIGGSPSPHMPVVSKESSRAPGHYNDNFKSIKSKAPQMSFPKSNRFLSQKVSMTTSTHQRELMAAESPGPKYNVNYLANNGGKAAPPQISFAAPPSPKATARAEAHKTRLPNVDSPQRGHRESWISVINRNGVLVMPASPIRPRHPAPASGGAGAGAAGSSTEPAHATATEERPSNAAPSSSNNSARGKNGGSMFGHEHRFGTRQQQQQQQQEHPRTPTKQPTGNSRVQFVSAKHTRENMGEFSPGPIYAPHNPDCPGGRLAPSPRSARRAPPPGSPQDQKDPHANMSSRASWLAGAVRKSEGQETVLMRMGDVPPGPGSYANPRSSFATFSHNTKAKAPRSTIQMMKAPRPTVGHSAPSPRKSSGVTRPAEPPGAEKT